MLETLEVKNAEGAVVDQVDYETETLQIDEIRCWCESAQSFRRISVWQFRAAQPIEFEELELKVIAHEAQRLMDLTDDADDFKIVTPTKEAL